ncbi:MAG: tetratricopeptide repeat protein [Betaproteobacteria bacterium]|nr:tetratricopeptide repeat protein [Betaproteobacteria bacterium]
MKHAASTVAVRFTSLKNGTPRGVSQRSEDLLARAIAHHGAGQFAPALDIYRQLLGDNPGHAKALELAGICCMQAGRHADAAGYLRAALKSDSDNHTLNNNLGVCLQHLGDFSGAAQALRQSVRLQPNYPEAHNNLGSVLEASNRLPEAVSAYLKVLELAPEHRAALLNLKRLACDPELAPAIARELAVLPVQSIALRELHFIAKAVCDRQSSAVTTQPLRLMLESAEAKAERGDAAGAIEEYQRVVAHNPRNAAAWNNLGLLFRRVHDYAQALSALARATQLDPDFAMAWNSLGSCYLDLGDLAQARGALERAKSLAPTTASIECNLGVLHRASQDATQALACYERALIMDSNLCTKRI